MANGLNDVMQDIDNFAVSESYTCGVEECKKVFPTQPALTVITQNIRSINCNFSGFQVLLTRLGLDCDIIILTECWLSCAPTIPIISGYCSAATTVNPIQNDGVVVYIKEQITFCIEEVAVQDCNCLLIKIGHNDTAILAVYRSPNYANLDPFLTSLDKILHDLSTFKNIIIMGDLNINIIEANPGPSTDQYLALTCYHGLLPAHYFTTRDASKTCIDHVLLKSKIPSVTIVPQSTLTDHKMVILCMKKKQIRNFSTLTHTRIDHEGLSNDITNINFEPIYLTDDCNLAMSYIVGELKTALNNNSTTVALSRRKKIIKPWITQGLLRCMRNRDKLHKISNSSPDNLVLKTTYTRYRNYCTSILKKVKRSYDRDLIQKAGKDSKKLWDTIKNITNTTRNMTYNKELLKLSHSPQDSVNTANNYYANVGRILAEKINQSQSNVTENDFSINREINSFVLLNTDEEEVECLILQLKNECSVGWDNIPNSLLKEHKNILVPHLTHIFNMCLTNGVFPKDLKRSRIHPIHKGGDRRCIENYRPISILPSHSKILEKIINIRLVEYLESNNILSEHQFGFRRGRSTDNAVSNLIDFITVNLDKGNKCVSIFLDLSKAFDTVSVPILVNKLEKIGIRGTQLRLMTSYLTDRLQCVKIGPLTSMDLPVSHGVPQGSVLGPTLFLIYINDLLSLNSFQGKLISYADDTVLTFIEKTWDKTFNSAQKGLDSVTKWLNDNALTLNADKTQYIAFSIRDPPQDPYKLTAHSCITTSSNNLLCQCQPLRRTNTVKYLGIVIDENCSFKPYIHLLSKRIRKLIHIFKTLRHVVAPIILKGIYFALCQSLVTYCISSWGGAPKTTLIQLEVAQRTILKLSTFKPFLYPTKLLYEFCEVLTVRQLFLQSIILRQHSLVDYNPLLARKRRNHAVCDCTIKPRTSFVRRFFPFLGPFIYNKINKIIEIYPLNKTAAKNSIFQWLNKLSYDETENLMIIPQ